MPRYSVPSMPARLAYVATNSAVFSRWRAACKASYASFGRTVSVRGWYFVMEWMQRVRLGHAPQSLVESLILVTLFFRLSRAGIHLMLVLPAEQVSSSESPWQW